MADNNDLEVQYKFRGYVTSIVCEEVDKTETCRVCFKYSDVYVKDNNKYIALSVKNDGKDYVELDERWDFEIDKNYLSLLTLAFDRQYELKVKFKETSNGSNKQEIVRVELSHD